VHTPRHIRKNSGFSTQEEHIVLLGLEALTKTPNLRYATRSNLKQVQKHWDTTFLSFHAALPAWGCHIDMNAATIGP
jgi:hypothetical protein